MKNMKAFVLSGIIILVATVMMGSMYVLGNKSYALPNTYAMSGNDITISNIQTVETIDTERIGFPTVVGNSVELELDMMQHETYTFKVDLTNATSLDYKITSIDVLCLNDENVNDYIDVNMYYDNGVEFKNNNTIAANSKRVMYVSVSSKLFEDMKTFELKLNFNMTPAR